MADGQATSIFEQMNTALTDYRQKKQPAPTKPAALQPPPALKSEPKQTPAGFDAIQQALTGIRQKKGDAIPVQFAEPRTSQSELQDFGHVLEWKARKVEQFTDWATKGMTPEFVKQTVDQLPTPVLKLMHYGFDVMTSRSPRPGGRFTPFKEEETRETAQKLLTAGQNVNKYAIKEAAQFVTDPVNIAFMASGGWPAGIRLGVDAVFGTMMTMGAFSAAQKAMTAGRAANWDLFSTTKKDGNFEFKPEASEFWQALGDTALNTFFARMGVHGAGEQANFLHEYGKFNSTAEQQFGRPWSALGDREKSTVLATVQAKHAKGVNGIKEYAEQARKFGLKTADYYYNEAANLWKDRMDAVKRHEQALRDADILIETVPEKRPSFEMEPPPILRTEGGRDLAAMSPQEREFARQDQREKYAHQVIEQERQRRQEEFVRKSRQAEEEIKHEAERRQKAQEAGLQVTERRPLRWLTEAEAKEKFPFADLEKRLTDQMDEVAQRNMFVNPEQFEKYLRRANRPSAYTPEEADFMRMAEERKILQQYSDPANLPPVVLADDNVIPKGPPSPEIIRERLAGVRSPEQARDVLEHVDDDGLVGMMTPLSMPETGGLYGRGGERPLFTDNRGGFKEGSSWTPHEGINVVARVPVHPGDVPKWGVPGANGEFILQVTKEGSGTFGTGEYANPEVVIGKTDPSAERRQWDWTDWAAIEYKRRQEAFFEDMAAVDRQHDLEDAAARLNLQAQKANTPEESEELTKKAEEAEGQARSIQQERDAEAAKETAKEAPKTHYREGAPLKEVQRGRDTEVTLPSGRKLKAHYALVSLDDVVASHSPAQNFQPNEKYIWFNDEMTNSPLQPNDYFTNKARQEAVKYNASNPKLGQIYNTTSTGDQGPSVVRRDGMVAGGNGRLMIQQLMYAVGRGNEVISAIESAKPQFGITAETPEFEKSPAIVRVLDDPLESTRDLIEVGQELNRDQMTKRNVAEDAAAMALRFKPDFLDWIADEFDAMDDKASIRDFMRKHAKKIGDRMLDDGFISRTERGEFIGEKGDINPSAKLKFERAIRGVVIKDPVALAVLEPEGMRSLSNALDRAMPGLLRMVAKGGIWDWHDYLPEAIRRWERINDMRARLNDEVRLAADLGQKGVTLVDAYLYPEKVKGTTRVLGDEDPFLRREGVDKITESVMRLMELEPKEIRDAINAYSLDAEGKQATFTAPPEPWESFDKNIASKVGMEIGQADWGKVEREKEPRPAAAEMPPKVEKFKFGNTQADIPSGSEAAQALEAARSRIADSDLAGKGKDIGGNHVTVRYGIKDADVAGIKAFLGSQRPFEARLGKTEKFKPTEQSEGAAVIQAPIESPELHRINDELAKHGNFIEPTFDYKPHATVAYVNPDAADRYVGMDVTAGKKFLVDSVTISRRDGSTEAVRLEGKPQSLEVPPVPPRAETAGGTEPTVPPELPATPREESLRQELAKHTGITPAQREGMITVWRLFSEKYLGTTFDDFLRDHVKEVKVGGEMSEKGGAPQTEGAVRRGMTEFMDDGQAIMHLFEQANFSTFAHESFHVMRRYLKPGDLQVLEKAAGVKDGNWGVASEEKAARMWERYLRDGQAPNAELKTLFAKIKAWMVSVYQKLKDTPLDIKVSPEVAKVFDRMVTGEKSPERLDEPPAKVEVAKPQRSVSDIQADIAATEKKMVALDKKASKPKSAMVPPAITAEVSARTQADWQKQNEKLQVLKNELVEPPPEAPKTAVEKALADLRQEKAAPSQADLLSEATEFIHEITTGQRARHRPKSAEEAYRSYLGNMGASRGNPVLPEAEFKDAYEQMVAAVKSIKQPPVQELDKPPLTVEEKKEIATDLGAPDTLFQEDTPTSRDLKIRMIRERLKAHVDPAMKDKLERMLAELQGEAPKTAARPTEPPVQRVEAPRPVVEPIEPPPRRTVKIWTPQGEIEVVREEPYGTKEAADKGRKPIDGIDRDKGLERPPEVAGKARPAAGTIEDETAKRGVQAGPRAGRGGGPREAGGRPLPDSTPTHIDPPKRGRGTPIYEPAEWANKVKTYLLPEGMPAPFVNLDPDLGRLLIFPGQKELAESVLSGLQQHDAYVLATTTGTGKTYLASAVLSQIMRREKPQHVLVLTKSQNLVKDFKNIALDFDVDVQAFPEGVSIPTEPGVYGTTYATAVMRDGIEKFPWDFVIFDEVAEARRWFESKQGMVAKQLAEGSGKVLYMSATPFHTALELGHMTKLGLWDKEGFDQWGKQFGIYRDKEGNYGGGNAPRQLVKLRNQLIERGQYANIDRNMQGYHPSFLLTPLSSEDKVGLSNIVEAFELGKDYWARKGKRGKMMSLQGNMVVYMKSYLERRRLPQAIELAKRAEKEGYKAIFFSEHKAGRNELFSQLVEPDDYWGGKIKELLPQIPDVVDELQKAFPNDIANFSGKHSIIRSEEKDAFLSNEKRHIFATYGAGGIGVSLHDIHGKHPRVAIYLGPPYSGVMLDQAIGRPWRYGTKSDVHAFYLVSNARDEVDLVIKKVGPRLESLRALVSGIDMTDPMTMAMRGLETAQDEALAFDLGQEFDAKKDGLTSTYDHVPIMNWRDVPIPPATEAMHKGMRYPGEPEPHPGIARMMQADEYEPPRDFEVPEPVEAKVSNDQTAEDFTNGEGTYGMTAAELRDIPKPERAQIAESVQLVADGAAKDNPEAPQAAVRRTWENNGKFLKAVQERVAESKPYKGGRSINWIWFTHGREVIRRAAARSGRADLGQDLARDIGKYHQQTGNVAGPFQARYYDIIKPLSKEEHDNMWLVKEGATRTEGGKKVPVQPMNEKVTKAVGQVRELLQDVKNVLAKENVYTEFYDPDTGRKMQVRFADQIDDPQYMPHRYDYNRKVVIEDPQVGTKETMTLREILKGKDLGQHRYEMIVNSLAKEHGISRAEVEDWMARRRRDVPLMGNVERSREVGMPFYRTDPEAMIGYLEGVGEVVSRSRVFGQDRHKLELKLRQIPEQRDRQLIREIFDSLLSRKQWDDDARALVSLAADWSVLSKMAFSAAKIPWHMLHASLYTDSRTLLKTVFEGAHNYKEMKERAIYSGAVLEQMRANLASELGMNQRFASKMLQWNLFHSAYTMDRALVNASARIWMDDHALPKLRKNAQNDRIRRELRDNFLLNDDQIDRAIESKRWTDEDYAAAGKALSDKVMFTFDPTELPPGWRARSNDAIADSALAAVRIATLLKSFMFKTSVIMKDRLWTEAKRGNFRPWIPFLMFYPAAGEAMRQIGGLLTLNMRQANWWTQPQNQEPAQILERAAEDIGYTIGWTELVWLMKAPLGQKAEAFLETLAGPFWNDIIKLFRFPAELKAAKSDYALHHAITRWMQSTAPVTRPLVKLYEEATGYDAVAEKKKADRESARRGAQTRKLKKAVGGRPLQ